MKNRTKFFKIASAGLFFGVMLPRLLGAPAESVTNMPPPQSVFIMPANPREGCDPFFPKSLRPYQSLPVVTTSHADLTSLVMQGISGPPGHRLAIINNVTFGAGDTAEVRTPQGRIRIHCVEVNEKSVMIEVGGELEELHYSQP